MNTAPAFVFLHGGQHGSWCWARLIAQLAPSGRALLALDVPGCGSKRGRDTAGLTLAGVAAELNADIRAAGLESAVLVGHSMAGALMAQMASLAPTLYRHLIYVAACVPRRGESVLDTLGHSLRGVDPAVVGWPLDPQRTPPLDMLTAMFAPGLDDATLQMLLAECVQDQWPLQLAAEPVALEGRDLPVPASYVVTARDPILPVAWQGRFAERAGARAMVVIDAPHEVFLTHPAELAELLLAAVG
jgi:pimeloyl-ACP methyl ester carboxylesterase